MAIEDGGQAFPVPAGFVGDGGDVWEPILGMSLRDWFAGQALTGYVARLGVQQAPVTLAGWAYLLADAMLVERARVLGRKEA